jgi:hypothetical protein
MSKASANDTLETEERQVVQMESFVRCLRYRNHVQILFTINREVSATEETAEVQFYQ